MFLINQVVVRKQKNGYHPEKNALFGILSLTNQLFRSRSIYLKSLEHNKIFFLENQVQDFISLRLNYLSQAIKVYKKTLRKDFIYNEKTLNRGSVNEMIDKLFKEVRENAAIIFSFEELYK